MIAAYLIFGHLSFFTSPTIALIMGIVLALAAGNPFVERTNRIALHVLCYSVVLLGFGVNIGGLFAAGSGGIISLVALVVLSCLVQAKILIDSEKKCRIPYLLLFLAIAIFINSYLALPHLFSLIAFKASYAGLNATLFLCGASLTRENIKHKRGRHLIKPLVLWLFILAISI